MISQVGFVKNTQRRKKNNTDYGSKDISDSDYD